MPDPFRLDGRIALVTGGATGIGKAIAIALARAGADVIVTVHTSGASETAAGVQAEGCRFAEIQTDLADFGTREARTMMDRAEEAMGVVDILVNNAGIIRRAPAAEFTEHDWREVLAVNLDAVWYLSQAAGRRMVEASGGSIVNVASLLSFQGGITVPAYTAAKHGVTGITKALANEWAEAGVRVNAIAPGYIATNNTAPLRKNSDRNAQILQRIPAGRWGDPEDLGPAAVFLASPAARYIHGHVLAVDGGWLAR